MFMYAQENQGGLGKDEQFVKGIDGRWAFWATMHMKSPTMSIVSSLKSQLAYERHLFSNPLCNPGGRLPTDGQGKPS
jgi:hypothetical protein